jgi:hypothetical protein
MQFLTDGRVFLLVLLVLALEAAVLVVAARRRDGVLRRYLPSLIAAAGLVSAALMALRAVGPAAVGLALLVALSAHLYDLLSLRQPAGPVRSGSAASR